MRWRRAAAPYLDNTLICHKYLVRRFPPAHGRDACFPDDVAVRHYFYDTLSRFGSRPHAGVCRHLRHPIVQTVQPPGGSEVSTCARAVGPARAPSDRRRDRRGPGGTALPLRGGRGLSIPAGTLPHHWRLVSPSITGRRPHVLLTGPGASVESPHEEVVAARAAIARPNGVRPRRANGERSDP